MFKLCVFVPESHLETLKTALFDAGAGKIGDYEQCCWQTSGIGQFRPLPGSEAFIGEVGSLEQVTEYKLELVCDDAVIQGAIAALLAAHPYETPAYEVYRLESF